MNYLDFSVKYKDALLGNTLCARPHIRNIYVTLTNACIVTSI